MRAHLIADGLADEATLAAIEVEAGAKIDDAIEFARQSDYPDLEELGRDVYAEEVLV